MFQNVLPNSLRIVLTNFCFYTVRAKKVVNSYVIKKIINRLHEFFMLFLHEANKLTKSFKEPNVNRSINLIWGF